jgi:hypothetical protein
LRADSILKHGPHLARAERLRDHRMVLLLIVSVCERYHAACKVDVWGESTQEESSIVQFLGTTVLSFAVAPFYGC